MILPEKPILACHYCVFDTSPDDTILTTENREDQRYIHICCGMSICMYHTDKGNHAHVNSPHLRNFV